MHIRLRADLNGSKNFSWETSSSRVKIGRNPDCDFIFEDNEETQFVSGEHAEMELNEQGLYLRDLQSSNGTFVNEKEVSGGSVKLNQGDEIRFGRSGPQLTVLEYVLPTPPAVANSNTVIIKQYGGLVVSALALILVIAGLGYWLKGTDDPTQLAATDVAVTKRCSRK